MRTMLLGCLLPLILAATAVHGQTLMGHWEGTESASGASLAVTFDFDSDTAGRYSSAQQRAMDYPLDAVTLKGKAAHFVLGGDEAFDATLDGDTLSGTFKGDDAAGTFVLRRLAPPPLPFRVEPVSFANGGVRLAGTLVEPKGKGPFPAMVLLQGSGPESRWGTNRFIADRLARHGIAALIYDKRGSGESGGDWKTADYDDLARDALAGIALLQRRPEIDARRVGLHGHSQGGIVAADAIRLAPARIGFVVAEDTVAGPVWQQDLYRVKGALAHDFPPDQAAAAMRLYSLFIEVARGNRPYADLEAAEAPVKSEPWFDWLGLPPRDSWLWAWYARTGTIDTLDYWRTVRVPVFLAYGQDDALVPVDESIAGLEGALAANVVPVTAVIVPRAEHNLTVHPQPGRSFFFWYAAPGYYDLMASWIAATASK